MIKAVIGNNVKREAFNFPSDTTLRSALESDDVNATFGGFDYSRGVMHLDGSSLNPGDLNKTFAELGYDGSDGKDKCFLLNVVKADNANRDIEH